MASTKIIAKSIEQIPKNQMIFASQFYFNYLYDQVSESSYYKTLERMCKSGELSKIAKGTYYRPKTGKYGIVPPSQREIVNAFIENKCGTVIGYSLFNSLRLTTQVSKTIEVLSSQIEGQTKTIQNVFVSFCNLDYTEEVEQTVHMMEVLQNFYEIQDINHQEFLAYSKKFAEMFSDSTFDYVIKYKHYPKRTISFLQEVLNYHQIPNRLNKYLSSLSEYKHPKMEEIYETAFVS